MKVSYEQKPGYHKNTFDGREVYYKYDYIDLPAKEHRYVDGNDFRRFAFLYHSTANDRNDYVPEFKDSDLKLTESDMRIISKMRECAKTKHETITRKNFISYNNKVVTLINPPF